MFPGAISEIDEIENMWANVFVQEFSNRIQKILTPPAVYKHLASATTTTNLENLLHSVLVFNINLTDDYQTITQNILN